jgi:hypothetical protein
LVLDQGYRTRLVQVIMSNLATPNAGHAAVNALFVEVQGLARKTPFLSALAADLVDEGERGYRKDLTESSSGNGVRIISEVLADSTNSKSAETSRMKRCSCVRRRNSASVVGRSTKFSWPCRLCRLGRQSATVPRHVGLRTLVGAEVGRVLGVRLGRELGTEVGIQHGTIPEDPGGQRWVDRRSSTSVSGTRARRRRAGMVTGQ